MTKPVRDVEPVIQVDVQPTGSPQSPLCGRGTQLATDIMAVVSAQCPRCTGTGTQCLIDLIYAEAFASTRTH